MRPPTICFTTAGLGKVEDQEIQTEIVETVDQYVQVESTTQHQGVSFTHARPSPHDIAINMV